MAQKNQTPVEPKNQSTVIREMASNGATNGAIAKALGIRYQTVWRTLNRPFGGVIPQVELEKKGIRSKETPLIQGDVERDYSGARG